MKIKCKECGSLLLDTKTGEGNYVIEREVDIGIDDRWNLVPVWGDEVLVCTVCGRKIKLSQLKLLGIEVKENE